MCDRVCLRACLLARVQVCVNGERRKRGKSEETDMETVQSLFELHRSHTETVRAR
jgi:hypothetical protein